MRIRTFCKLLEVSELQPLTLRDATVVVDGQNFFYNTYKDSGLPHKLGCESHRYASYLREQLAMFKKANVKCYFLFKGGIVDMAKRLEKVRDDRSVHPIFMKTIYKEVLDEMEFPYVICEYESKRDIIALAQTLDCPIISYDIEYCFSGLRYIPRNEIKFNKHDNTINCRYFTLDRFMQKYKLNAEKIAMFITLTDEKIFPENFFLDFLNHIKAPLSNFTRNIRLLYWLSKNSRENSLKTLFKFVSGDDKSKFVEELSKAELMIGRREAGGLGAACLRDRGAAAVAPGDPDWFPKGVAGNHVAINYINLYRSQHFFGSIDLDEEQDPMLLCLEIVKYAYDLLTNFQNEGFTFVYDSTWGRQTMTVSETYSIRKPEYEADVCVFENGWGELRELGLFEHFLKETVELFDLQRLEKLPADARLLVVALVYFSRKKRVDTSAEVACVLLSYVTLSVVLEKCDKTDLPRHPFAARPILDSSTDKDAVTDADCNTAAAIMADFLSTSDGTVEHISDRELLLPWVEFQHCLRQLCDLNALCGAPFAAPALRRSLSGGLVCRLRRAARDAGDTQLFLDRLLSPAPTVYAFLNGLIEACDEM